MAIGEAIAGALGGAGNLLSSFVNVAQQKSLAKYQAKLNYKYAEKSARNTPTWNRAGLENAGYNPMLAVQNATSGANSSWTSPQSVNNADISGGVSAGLANARDQQRVDNETATAESTQHLNNASAVKATSEAITNAIKLPWIDKREKAEIENTVKGTAKMQSEIDNIEKTTEYIEKNYQLQEYLADLERRGQDLSFKSSLYGVDALRYGADRHYAGSVYNANTLSDIAEKHSPSGRSQSFRNYAGGVADILQGAGSIISPFKGKFDRGYESEEHTYNYDRHGKLSSERHTGRTNKRR